MGLFDEIKAAGASYRLTEEALFAEALREVETGIRRDGLWAKALADADGDAAKAKARYLKLRVQSLKDEAAMLITAIKQDKARTAIEAPGPSKRELDNLAMKEDLKARYTPPQVSAPTPWRQRWITWGKFATLFGVGAPVMWAIDRDTKHASQATGLIAAAMFVGLLFVGLWFVWLLINVAEDLFDKARQRK